MASDLGWLGVPKVGFPHGVAAVLRLVRFKRDLNCELFSAARRNKSDARDTPFGWSPFRVSAGVAGWEELPFDHLFSWGAAWAVRLCGLSSVWACGFLPDDCGVCVVGWLVFVMGVSVVMPEHGRLWLLS